jgi:polysaccharide deacetylase family protein (PEP-CTERM system associated)
LKNIFSIDIERWSDRGILNAHSKDVSESLFLELDIILKLLDVFNQKGTFFTLGEISRDFPELIERIVEEGHEISVHGWNHDRLEKFDRESFEKDLEKSVNSIMHITKERPLGFRAPVFSLSKKTHWLIESLIKHRFSYDSSIFPCSVPFYGSADAPCYPYYPAIENPEKIDHDQKKIIEFPLLINEIYNLKIPAAGGFWLRLFGPNFVLRAIEKMNKKGIISTIYIHTWELNKIPVKSNLLKKTYLYYKIPIVKKLKYLFKNVKFYSARDTINDI